MAADSLVLYECHHRAVSLSAGMYEAQAASRNGFKQAVSQPYIHTGTAYAYAISEAGRPFSAIHFLPLRYVQRYLLEKVCRYRGEYEAACLLLCIFSFFPAMVSHKTGDSASDCCDCLSAAYAVLPPFGKQNDTGCIL